MVENWSDVRGRVERVEEAPDGASAPVLLQVRVESADRVGDYPNLLADAVGKSVALRGPRLPRVPQVGESIRCRVRRAGLNQYFYSADSLTVQ